MHRNFRGNAPQHEFLSSGFVFDHFAPGGKHSFPLLMSSPHGVQHARAEELIHLDVNAALEGREFATVFPQRPEFDSFEAPVLLHVRRVRTHPPPSTTSPEAQRQVRRRPSFVCPGALRMVFAMIGLIYKSNLSGLVLDSCDTLQGMEHVKTAEDGREMVLLRAAALVSEPCTLSTQPAQPAAEPPRIALQISEGEVSCRFSKEHRSLYNWIRYDLS